MALEEVWQKSERSAGHGECVEARRVIRANGEVGAQVRDTTHRDLGELNFNALEWSSLVRGMK